MAMFCVLAQNMRLQGHDAHFVAADVCVWFDRGIHGRSMP
jgi:hypothetical protein